MDIANFKRLITQIAKEREIPFEKVIETIESAIAAAYKKDYGKKGQIIQAKLDLETGKVEFLQIKQVLDTSMVYSEEELEKLKEKPISKTESQKVKFNPERHIMIEEAQKIDSKIKAGSELKISLKTEIDYGRIATQAAKQVILQKLKETERDIIFDEYKSKEGEIISGIVQRVERNNIYVDMGKTLGILSREEQVWGEFYRPKQRMKFYILNVEKISKGPVIFLSRAHPKLVSKLFELEVPEISSGAVQIKAIAREPGFRTKIAVASTQEGIDPIGSLVGQKGTRIMAVINELGGEKIDVIEYSDDAEKYIANSLSPAKVLEVRIEKKNTALVIVPSDQLSLAIGKDGRNVRLAAKLINWKINVRGSEEVEEKKEEEEEKKPSFAKAPEGKKEKKEVKEEPKKPAFAKGTSTELGRSPTADKKEKKRKEKKLTKKSK